MSQLTDFFDGIRGVPFPYFGLVAPSGFLLCDGSAVSRTTYAVLFKVMSLSMTGNTTNASAVIGGIASTTNVAVGMPLSGPGIPAGATVSSFVANTSITMSANATATATGVTVVIAPYGVGDGSTTFNIPDCRGRAFSGRDDMGGTAASRLTNSGTGINGTTLGAAGGVETHTLTSTQIPAHSHPVFLNDPGHTHAVNAGSTNGSAMPGGSQITGTTLAGITSSTTGISVRDTAGGGGTANQTAINAGGGSAHPNVQPTMIVNYIVKT